MSDKNKVVLGIYQSRSEVERAVEVLKTDGFSTSDISVLMQDKAGSQDFAHTKGTKAPEGAATGASTGAAIGGTLGLLAGIGALAIPGIGPFIAAGPIMAALAGAGVGGAIGGIGGALIGLGIPEYEAKRYEGFVKDGGILMSVHATNSDEVDKAKKCLKETGAKDISSTGEVKADRSSAAQQTSANQTSLRKDSSLSERY
ncbi:MAG: DUF3341 domain-containing protein [Bdellovibrionales bacterium CG10_big_fil_rev_8_21_14_0_10_45_34]|nr:MAG: DUF3341 domain-containing protein [Bdellovibrionales bacterium CG10_big_fil_rev_8_21_14_0_10_45_34]